VCAPRALSPPPLPLDHPAQRLTAGGAAKLAARAATTPGEGLVTAGTLAAKKFESLGWALTLAGLRRPHAGGFR